MRIVDGNVQGRAHLKEQNIDYIKKLGYSRVNYMKLVESLCI
jgi:hypothetical protein